MPPRDGADEAQPETISGGCTARLEAHKTVEHGFSVCGRDPGTVVGHFDDRQSALRKDADIDFASSGVFERIVQQIS